MTRPPTFTHRDGGVCATPGVTAAGVAAGLKPSGKFDLAVVDAGERVAAAAIQTTNQVVAAPVKVTTRHAADGMARAVLLNSGSANVCTGPDGEALAEESAAVAASALGCESTDVLLASTGVIGVPIDRDALLAGIPSVVAARSNGGGTDAATAIRTTDTTTKQAALFVSDGSGGCTVGGMAKGSGMIDPAMATMLCVITTDAPLAGAVLRGVIRAAVNRTFNRISVDGCASTNDAVIALATGAATRPPGYAAFAEAVERVCASLAEAIVRDGEGATKLLHVKVVRAGSEGDAVEAARAVARSALVKTALAGGDPNWGRVLAALGAGPVRIDPDRVSVAFGGVTVCRHGMVAPFDREAAARQMAGEEVWLTIDLDAGDAEGEVLTCDLTKDYIRINAEYTT